MSIINKYLEYIQDSNESVFAMDSPHRPPTKDSFLNLTHPDIKDEEEDDDIEIKR